MSENIPTADIPTKVIEKPITRRRNLLPWWIKMFTWMFFIFAAFVPVGIVLGLLKIDCQLNLLGLTTNQPISLVGLSLLSLFTFKGIVSYALWQEKEQAINLAKIDAVISAVICIVTMVVSFFGNVVSIRLELIIIFLFYYKLDKIQYDWENFEVAETENLTNSIN